MTFVARERAGDPLRLITRIPLNSTGKAEEDDDDCIILEKNPFDKKEDDGDDCIVLDTDPYEEETTRLSKMLSLGCNLKTSDGAHNLLIPKIETLHPQEQELSIIAEKGKVACRDYPHSRHLCAHYPFDKTPHETYCSQCYCYVCDIRAPCEDWNGGHCHASDFEIKWKQMRKSCREMNKWKAVSAEVGKSQSQQQIGGGDGMPKQGPRKLAVKNVDFEARNVWAHHDGEGLELQDGVTAICAHAPQQGEDC